MGQASLAQWRAKKLKLVPNRPRGIVPPKGLRLGQAVNERTITRIVAALIHNVPHATIAQDLRIPRRTVEVVAMRERYL